MTTIHATEAALRPARSIRAIVNIVVNFLRAMKNRREFYRLGEMSDAELSDIGLVRADLNVAMDLPFTRDPTAHLGHMAEARRREIEVMARRVN